ncbi:MAG: B12-binding domain-containing radical SAM protein [Bacteroidota bacterium]|nr:B12-binding domain-containing radical SAM protein [Bacteroidota bacterium]
MKIILTHGYFLEEDEREKLIMKPYVPLGILYISAYLEKNGFDNDVFDSTFSSFENFKTNLKTSSPGVIGIYTNLMTKLNVLRIIKFIRGDKQLDGMKIILGGPEVRNHAQEFLLHGADALVIGEGEETMLQLIKAFSAGMKDLSGIKGIAFIAPDNEVTITADQSLLKSIDELPFPNRKKINLQRYFDAWKNAHGSSTLSLSTMRGCPYTCKWCSRAVYGGTYRRRSARLVVDEILMLQSEYTFDNIWFVDDVFTISHKWLKEFADEIAQRKVKVKYEIITRADRLNEEVIDLLVSSGCFRVWIGAESGSQNVIDAMDRRVDVIQVREMIRLTRKKGMEAGTFIMLGYPGETQRDIKETIRHLNESMPDYFTITLAYPIKGTPLYAETKSKFINPRDWETSTDRDIDFKRTYSRRYYDFALRWVHNEVAFKKNLHIGKLSALPLLKMKSLAAQGGMFFQRIIK